MSTAMEIALERVYDWRFGTPLDLSELGLTELPSIPDGVEELNVSYNELQFLPNDLPDTIQELNVSHNWLTELPDPLPGDLFFLIADHNRLTHLPEYMPNSIAVLNVGYNQLTHLPDTLPEDLDALNLQFNQLTYLPDTLPDGVTSIIMCGNPITLLPEQMPSELRELNIYKTNITTFPAAFPPPHMMQLTVDPSIGMLAPTLDSIHWLGRSFVPAINFTYEEIPLFVQTINELAEIESRERCIQRCSHVWQELLEVSLHPDRVGPMLGEGVALGDM